MPNVSSDFAVMAGFSSLKGRFFVPFSNSNLSYGERLIANNGRTRAVGQKKPNAWGLHDMHGNVWEWCQDAWHDSYDGAPPDGSAWEDAGASERVLRGGSWNFVAGFCRSANRVRYVPGVRYYSLGFRPTRSLGP